MKSVLQERSVLMQLTTSCVGMARKDKRLTAEVQVEKALGGDSGKWIKSLWPEHALEAIKSKITEARDYHDKVTLPFGCRKSEEAAPGEDGQQKKPTAIAGVGILPAALIVEYRERMRVFNGELAKLVNDFLANPRQWIDWAVMAHNGTFNPKDYPGCTVDASGALQFDANVFRAKMRGKFSLTSEILPVPGGEQFSEAIASLIGVDALSVDIRVRDSELEARRELMRRLIAPVKAMAVKLAEVPKDAKHSPVFRDTLVGNLKEIVRLAPALNISGDPMIDDFVGEVESLTRYSPDTLRESVDKRKEAAAKAAEALRKLEGYSL